MNLFVHTPHLWREDRELFAHEDSAFRMALERATEDVLRDLDRHGVDTAAVEDAFRRATVELTFTAPGTHGLTIPAGVGVANVDSERSRFAGVVFKTDFDLVVPASDSRAVRATAVMPGAPANVDAGELVYLTDPATLDIEKVTNLLPATGGADHQLTRAATYRAMELVYLDLMRTNKPPKVFAGFVSQLTASGAPGRLRIMAVDRSKSMRRVPLSRNLTAGTPGDVLRRLCEPYGIRVDLRRANLDDVQFAQVLQQGETNALRRRRHLDMGRAAVGQRAGAAIRCRPGRRARGRHSRQDIRRLRAVVGPGAPHQRHCRHLDTAARGVLAAPRRPRISRRTD